MSKGPQLTIREGLALVIAVVVAFAALAVTSAGADEHCNENTRSNKNHECYWEDQYEDTYPDVECTKLDDYDETSYTVPPPDEGNTWVAIILKAGNENAPGIENAHHEFLFAEGDFAVGDHLEHPEVDDISHVIGCQYPTPGDDDPTPVDLVIPEALPPTCEAPSTLVEPEDTDAIDYERVENAGIVSIIATIERTDQYTFSGFPGNWRLHDDGVAIYSHKIVDLDCPDPMEPTIEESNECGVPSAYIIPDDENFNYLSHPPGELPSPIKPGRYEVGKNGAEVTVIADSIDENKPWNESWTLVLKGYTDCPDPEPEPEPEPEPTPTDTPTSTSTSTPTNTVTPTPTDTPTATATEPQSPPTLTRVQCPEGMQPVDSDGDGVEDSCELPRTGNNTGTLLVGMFGLLALGGVSWGARRLMLR